MEAKEQNSTSVNNSFMQESVMDINNVLESTRTKEGKTMETNAENIEQEMKAKRKKKELEQQPIQQEETLNPLEVKIQQMQQKINALEKQLEEKNNFSNINKPNITETTNEESEITQTAQTKQQENEQKTLDFSMVVGGKFKTYSNMQLKEHNEVGDYCVLSNGKDSVTVSTKTFEELNKPAENKQAEPNYRNMIKNQYDYYFEPKKNTANNFRHNLSVYCRKEANSPVEALNIAKELIGKMDTKEQEKIKLLLKQMENEEQTVNDIVVGMYHEAVKEFPLNEDIIQKTYPGDARKRLTSDVISEKGKAISDDGDINKNPKIGQTFSNIVMKVDSVVGNGKKEMQFDSLTLVSSSKTSNKVTLMDKNNSYIEVDREKFIDSYKKNLEQENKQSHKKSRSNTMEISY